MSRQKMMRNAIVQVTELLSVLMGEIDCYRLSFDNTCRREKPRQGKQ
jgi:hypothetical protein